MQHRLNHDDIHILLLCLSLVLITDMIVIIIIIVIIVTISLVIIVLQGDPSKHLTCPIWLQPQQGNFFIVKHIMIVCSLITYALLVRLFVPASYICSKNPTSFYLQQ